MLQGSSFPQIFHCTTGAYQACPNIERKTVSDREVSLIVEV